jgi:hypothetical protein
MTEKKIAEEELMGLEREIDAAVDRLFVEKIDPDGNSTGALSSTLPTSPGPDRGLGRQEETFQNVFDNFASRQQGIISDGAKEPMRDAWETFSPSEPLPPPPFTPSPSGPIEKLETQLLSLEWEITKENLGRTVREVLALRGGFKETPDISSILNRMVLVLNHMIQDEEGIQPHLIRFLLDSKETIKLLLRKEPDDDLLTYKKLAYAGIEGRFSSLEGLQEFKPGTSSQVPPASPDLIEKIVHRMESFSQKMDEMMQKMDEHLSAHERLTESSVKKPANGTPLKMKVTVFKRGETLLGVESDKVFKLYKVPDSLSEKMAQLRKVRLNGLETKMIDLKSLVPISGESQEGGEQVLILRGDGEYKGLMVDRVLNRLSGPLETGGEFNEYLLGMIRWTYQELPIRVPILDFGKV